MTTLLDMNTGYIAIGAGANAFDTRNKYLRHGTTGDYFPVVKGKTISVATAGTGTARCPNWKWADSINSYAYTETGSAVSFSPSSSNVYIP